MQKRRIANRAITCLATTAKIGVFCYLLIACTGPQLTRDNKAEQMESSMISIIKDKCKTRYKSRNGIKWINYTFITCGELGFDSMHKFVSPLLLSGVIESDTGNVMSTYSLIIQFPAKSNSAILSETVINDEGHYNMSMFGYSWDSNKGKWHFMLSRKMTDYKSN